MIYWGRYPVVLLGSPKVPFKKDLMGIDKEPINSIIQFYL